jgi:peptidoglycan/LPS O-acetylase OafA/YrhL
MTATQDLPSARTIADPPGPSRLPSLTGLRFVAAFLVFVYHVRTLSIFGDQDFANGYRQVVESTGNIAVSAFFVLSGFVLTWSARRGDRTRSFYRRRFFKVFPNHVVVFFAALAFLLIVGEPVGFWSALTNLFLVNTWIPNLTLVFGSVNGPTWSLSVELAFYVTFPLWFVLIRKIQPARLWYWAIGIAMLAVLMPMISQAFLPDTPVHPYIPGMSLADMWFLYFGPIVRMAEFTVGMILARIVQTGRWIGIRPLPIAVLVVGVFLAGRFLLPISYGLAVLYPLPLALLVASLAAGDVKGRRSILASKPMVWLGDISYAYFLIHLPLLLALQQVFGQKFMTPYGPVLALGWSPLAGLLYIAGSALLCGFLAWLLHAFVERPSMRHWSRPRRPIQRAH